MSIGTPIDEADSIGFRVTRRGGMGGNLITDKGGSWVEAVRVTRAEHSRRFLSLNYAIEYVTTHFQEIPQRIR